MGFLKIMRDSTEKIETVLHISYIARLQNNVSRTYNARLFYSWCRHTRC